MVSVLFGVHGHHHQRSLVDSGLLILILILNVSIQYTYSITVTVPYSPNIFFLKVGLQVKKRVQRKYDEMSKLWQSCR